MTLNSSSLKKLEGEFPFSLTPEQRNIMLFWFGTDSKFGWSKLDFIIGAHRVKNLYPDHRQNLYRGFDGLPYDTAIDFAFDYDFNGNPAIHFYQDDDGIPF